ncbi:MAG: hypothetical protein IJ092_06790 [Atopobiaceae bacterium]|nr:hypothetical protein [Atopobiaceae bacterium]
MEFKDLTDAQKAKAMVCKTPDEILEFAKNEGIELAEEQLEQISGGDWTSGNPVIYCDECHKTVEVTEEDKARHRIVCPYCGTFYAL